MNTILLLLNETVFYQFVGAFIAIAITVTVVFLQKYHKRKQRRSYYEGIKIYHDLGDIDVKVNEDLPYENVPKIIFVSCLQPLLLIFLLSFIDNRTIFLKLVVFIIVFISTIIHEFMASDEHIDKTLYRIFLSIIWIVSFLVLSYETNVNRIEEEKLKNLKELTYTSNTSELINCSFIFKEQCVFTNQP